MTAALPLSVVPADAVYATSPGTPAALHADRKAQARALGITYWHDAGSYQMQVMDRIVATVHRNGGSLLGEHEVESVGDGIIRNTLNAGRKPYTAKVGDCFTRFATFEEALALMREAVAAEVAA